MKYLLLLILLSCGCRGKHAAVTEPVNGPELTGVVMNLTGLDGCSWIIKLDKKTDDGLEKLEPVNLADFNVTLSEGQPVSLSFEKIDGGSICMVGQLVRLKTFTAR